MATSIAAAVSLTTTTHHRRRQRVTPSANMNDNRFRARRTSQPLSTSTASRRSGAVSTDAPSAATATTTQGGGVSSRWRGPSADEAAGASPPPPGGAAPARDEEEAEVAPAHRGGLEVPNWHYRDLIDQGRVFRETFPVRYDEAGPDKRATMHTVASMVAECACNHAQALWGLGQSMPAGMLAANLGWVCTRMHIVVDAYPAWGDQVEVNTWFEAQGKIAARRDFAITSVGNGGSVETPVGVATSQWVAFNIEKRKMARIPAAVLHEFKGQALADSPVMGADYAAAVAKLPDVRGVPGCDVDTSGHVTTVRRSDVDMNGHVNNVVYAERYAEWLLEAVPADMWEGHELKELELEYRSECSYGDVVDAVTCREEEAAAAAAAAAAEGDAAGAVAHDDGRVRLVHMLLKRGAGKKEAEVVRARTVWEPKRDGNNAGGGEGEAEGAGAEAEETPEKTSEAAAAVTTVNGVELDTAADGTVTFKF